MKFNAFLEGEKELIDSLKRMDKDAKKKVVEKPFGKQAEKIKSKAEKKSPRSIRRPKEKFKNKKNKPDRQRKICNQANKRQCTICICYSLWNKSRIKKRQKNRRSPAATVPL